MSSKGAWLALALVLALVLAAYAPLRQCGFVNYDDDVYVTRNPQVRAGLSWATLHWGLTTFHFGNWHPLVWWSYLLDHQLYGLDAAGFHRTNLLWHLASTLVLFAALRRMTNDPWPSLFVAGLFAVHPLNVQPVAWVAERKGVICSFFWVLALWAYACYVERPRWWRYLLVAAAMALALMAKQMAVTLPCVLLLLDFWPLARKPRDGRPWAFLVLEKVPLLLLAAAASAMTILAQRGGGSIIDFERIPLAARLNNVAVSYVLYLRQAVWPTGLTAFYPHPGSALTAWQGVAAAALLVAITALLLWQARRVPFAVVGWLWYLGTLVPVIGIVQVGAQARADRYTYIPLVGIFIAGAWSLAAAARRLGLERPALALAGLVLAALAIVTWEQVHYWQDSAILWSHNIDTVGGTSTAHHNLAQAIKRSNRPLALEHYREAIRLDPENVTAHVNLGVYLMEEGDWADAVRYLRSALQFQAGNATAHAVLGAALVELGGDQDEAARHLQEALRLHEQGDVRAIDELAMIHYTLGVVRALQGRLDEAEGALREACTLAPTLAGAQRELGYVLSLRGRGDEARSRYQESLRLEPGWPERQQRQAWALATDPDPQRRDGRQALRLAWQANDATGGGDYRMLDTLAAAYAETRQFPQAITAARSAAAAAHAAGASDAARVIEARLKHYERGESGSPKR